MLQAEESAAPGKYSLLQDLFNAALSEEVRPHCCCAGSHRFSLYNSLSHDLLPDCRQVQASELLEILSQMGALHCLAIASMSY